MTTKTIEVYHELEDSEEEVEYQVTFEFYVNYTPAVTSGPPDNWCPADYDSHYDIEKVTKDGNKVEMEKLDEEVRLLIHERIDEWITDEGESYQEEDNEPDYEPDYDDWDDSCYGPYGFEG